MANKKDKEMKKQLQNIINRKRYDLIEKVQDVNCQSGLDYIKAQKDLLKEIEEELDA